MKFLCLAYGDENGWNSLSESEKQEAFSQDAVIRDRGNFMSAVRPEATCVKNWGGKLDVVHNSFAQQEIPLAGFSIIEAENLDEVIELVSNTPCARARGAVEIHALWDARDGEA